MNEALVERVRSWITGDPDPADRATIQQLLDDGDEAELSRRFAQPLQFGTAGLRGPVMAGPAGMNRYTVRRATQGVVAWLKDLGIDSSRGVVVGRDARRGSESFNDEVVEVLLGAGVAVIEMPRPLPTPLVAYAVKALGAAAGIMITASHNPPDDNGYKLYAADGAQIAPPDDQLIEGFANEAGTAVLADRSSPLHRVASSDLWETYLDHFARRFAAPGTSALAITYTPLHGVGGESMMELFRTAGFVAVTPVATQFTPDGRFPTLAFPNPEEPGALDLAMETADENASDLVIANDPDADRLGVAVRASDGWRVLRGDEIGWLLASTLLDEMTASDDVVATTIVSSTMLELMARSSHVRFVTTLTGFKWIARAAGDGVLRFGYEEALGFAVDPLVADKDGMSAALAICQLADDLARSGATLLDRLDEIETRFGVHAGGQLSLRADGPDGPGAIATALRRLRSSPPSTLGHLPVSSFVDLAGGWHGLSATDGVYIELRDAGRIVVRPSGTEPKLKVYIEIIASPNEDRPLDEQRKICGALLNAVRDELAELLRL